MQMMTDGGGTPAEVERKNIYIYKREHLFDVTLIIGSPPPPPNKTLSSQD